MILYVNGCSHTAAAEAVVPDVFAVDDLGIQQAMMKLYHLDPTHKKQLKIDMLERSKAWSPYRTYACLHLWRWKDNP